jgi:hypothetical protein
MARPARDERPDANGVHVEALEQRVRRLEDAVAAIQDTQIMEDRVVERVCARVEHAPFPPLRESAGMVVTAARMLMPKTIHSAPDDGTGSPTADGSAADVGRPWMILGVLNELRWIVRMLTDYRYRMTWTGRSVLVVAIIVVVLSWFMLSGLPVVGGLIDRVVLVLAAVVTYKAMTREVARYQELMARIYRYR